MYKVILTAAFFIVTINLNCRGMFIQPSAIPLHRVVKNTEATAQQFHYLLQSGWELDPVSAETAIRYAQESEGYFLKGILMEPSEALFYLGIASLYEEIMDFVQIHYKAEELFSHVTTRKTASFYWKAFELSKDKDAESEMNQSRFISYEAGRSWIRLDGKDPEKLEIFKDHLPSLENKKYSFITPLVISDRDINHPSELQLASESVQFDLDADGQPESRSWVRPDIGILVWDPYEGREITSGHQLFGNNTFQLFWTDGFEALSVLDDNGNGLLEDSELIGLSLWHDKNSNGTSAALEVIPIDEKGIVALSLNNVEIVDGTMVSKGGVIFEEAPPKHLWDWISHSN